MISVVVPVLNRAGLIERCLDSIAAQDVRPLRLIVVDNGSTDGTVEVVRRWMLAHEPDRELTVTLLEERRPGAARARQTGLDIVDTEWVYFFDSDDVLNPGILSAALAVGEGYDLVRWRLDVHQLDGSVSHMPLRGDLVRAHVFNAVLSTQSYMIRTGFLRECGGWDPAVMVWNDWELGIRIVRHAPRARALDRAGVTVYRQAESITGVDFTSKAGRWEEVMDGIYRTVGDDRRLREMVDYRRVILAAHYRREGSDELARALLDKTLHHTTCSAWRKQLLRLIYRYTAAGGRAAYLLWR